MGTVIFDADGGVFSSNGSNTLAVTGPVGKIIYSSEIEVPSKDGYLFNGWEENLRSIRIQSRPDKVIATWTPISES